MRLLSAVSQISALFGALAVAGCSMMPANGPSASNITATHPTDAGQLPYALITLTPKILGVLAQNAPALSNVFPDRRLPGDMRFGTGDVVSVTIFEASSGGLFTPTESTSRNGNFVTLPNQSVDSAGNISIPYAGIIHARGRTTIEVQHSIVDALKNRAIDPQAIVTVVEQRTSMISVLGDVNHPERFPASAAPERLLDAITRAGGPKSEGFDTWVMLERDGNQAKAPFGALVYAPSNNIFVRPNDTIYLYSEPQTFIAFGATAGASAPATSTTTVGSSSTASQGQFNFGAWRISLAEALAKAGGLNDALADPASVFLYRGETRHVMEKLGVDCSKFEGPIIPVIYHVNLRDPSGYFVAKQFDMRNKDILYVSDAQSIEVSKVLNYLQLIMATVDDPIVYATNFYGLKAAIHTTSASNAVLLGN